MARTIGIDLGSHMVKLAIFEGSLGRFQLSDYRVRRIEQDDQTPPDMPARLDALAALLEEERSKERTLFAAAYPAESASFRLVSLPFSDRAKVEKTLPFEVEGLVPFDLDTMVVNSRIISQEPERTDVLAALAARDRIGSLLAGLAAVGADPKYLVIDADVLGWFGNSGVQAILDIGHSRTLITVVHDGRVVAARAIHGGGRTLTLALAEAAGISYDEAEGRKHVARIPASAAVVEWEEDQHTSPGAKSALEGENGDLQRPASPAAAPGGEDGEVLRRAFAPILAEIRATLIALEDAQDLEIGELLLAGGTAELGGLASMLQDDLGVPVRRLTVSDHAEALGDPARFALAHALGLKAGGGTRGREMDLRAEHFQFRGDLAILRNVALAGAAAAALFVVAGLGMFGWKTVQLQRDLAEVEGEITAAVAEALPEMTADQLADSKKAVAIMQEKASESAVRVEALGAIVDPTPPTLSLWREVSRSVPQPTDARIDLAELNITPNSVTLKGATDGYEDATEIEAALQENDRFKQARKGEEKKKRDGLQFTITIPLEGEEAEEG